MSEKLKTLALTLDDTTVTLTLIRATARIGVARYQLISKGYEHINDSPDEDEALKALRVMVYPDCICGTSQAEGIEFPIPFEQFVELPEEFVNQWADAVYLINPHWKPGAGITAETPLPNAKKPSKKG